MKIIDDTKFNQFCSQANICIADPTHNIGRELTYCDDPLRTIVIHAVDSDPIDYIAKLFNSILSIEDSWMLAPRFIYQDSIKINDIIYKNEILSFEQDDKKDLLGCLIDYKDRLNSVGNDLYILGNSGAVIVSYDHHIIDDGLSINLTDVKLSEKLLVSLNDLGAELDLISKN